MAHKKGESNKLEREEDPPDFRSADEAADEIERLREIIVRALAMSDYQSVTQVLGEALVEKDPQPPQCGVCKGAGMVRSRDGRRAFPCQYCDNPFRRV